MEENNKNVREVYYSFHTTKPFWIDFFQKGECIKMAKVDLDDIDIIDIVQLASCSEIPMSEEQIKNWNKTIMSRMSDKAEDQYIHNIIPVSRQTTL